MTSFAIDLVAIAQALQGKRLEPHDTEQYSFITWCEANGAAVAKQADARVRLADDYGVLNEFLAQNSQQSAFGPFYGLGFASVREVKASCTALNTGANIQVGEYSFSAFEAEATLFRVSGQPNPYIRIGQDGQMVWILPVNQKPASPLELFEMSQLGRRRSTKEKQVVRVPVVDLTVRSSLPWLRHLSVEQSGGGSKSIVAAVQNIRVRMSGRTPGKPQPAKLSYTVQQPFVMGIGQKGRLPQVAAYVDFNSWRVPDKLS